MAITPDIETKLDYIGEAVKEKPQLKFKMIQHFDPQQAARDMGVYLVKHDFFKKEHQGTDIVDFFMVNNIDEKDPAFQQFVQEQTGTEVSNEKSLIQACYELKESQIRLSMDTLPESWNQHIISNFKQKEVPAESIFIETTENDKGKFLYQLEVELLEETSQISPDSITNLN